MKRRIAGAISLSLFFSTFLSQSYSAEETHEPILDSNVYLGYQMDIFNERLGDIQAEGTVFNVFRAGGRLRLYNGVLFSNYYLLSQPVTNQTTSESFNRLTHYLDAGLGYAFTLIPNKLELLPFLGMVGQFNSNDENKGDPSIYYHVPQTRLGFGGGLNLAWRFWGPLSLIAGGGFYPFMTATTDSTANTGFPPNLNLINLNLGLHAQILPYLGGELGFSQHLYNGGDATNAFSASWSDLYAKVSFEPEVLFQKPVAPTPTPAATPTPRPTPTALPTPTPAPQVEAIKITSVTGNTIGIIQPTSSWNPVTEGAILKPGDALRTQNQARIVAAYASGIRFILEQNSLMLLKPEMAILARGELAMIIPQNQTYAIQAYKTIIHSNGNRARINIKVENKIATITVLEGSVRIEPETGEAQTVNAGMQVIAAPQSPLTTPKTIDINLYPFQ